MATPDLEHRVAELERLVRFLGRTVLLLVESFVPETVRRDLAEQLADEFAATPTDPA